MVNYDLVVLGGGPGGYVAAIRAAQLGAKVALIEKEKVGGTCLNHGCIPTKALLACTTLYDRILKAESFGISIGKVSIDLNKVVERKNQIVAKLVKGIELLLEKNQIDLIRGTGKIIEPGKVEVESSGSSKLSVVSHKLILATGSSPSCLPGMPFNGQQFLSSDDILSCREIPPKLDIIGGGVIGLHFAFVFSSLGSEVTIYEALPEILPGIDEDIIALAKRILARRKIKIITNTRFKTEDSCGKTLVCVGRIPNTGQLKSLPLKYDGQKIWVNDKMETNLPGVYAIGDLVSHKMFAHVATEQGIVAAENALGQNKSFDYHCVPYTIYTQPEIAGVGVTEQDIPPSADKQDIRIGKFPFAALGIAQTMGEIEGFVKVVADKNNRILGVHIIGPEANTIIGSAAICLKNGLTIDQLASTIQAHPSYPEGLQETALNVLKRSLHIIN